MHFVAWGFPSEGQREHPKTDLPKNDQETVDILTRDGKIKKKKISEINTQKFEKFYQIIKKRIKIYQEKSK